MGTPLSLQMWGDSFPKIPVIGHYQGVTQKFWAGDLLKNGKNNVSKSSLSQHVMCFPNAAGIDGSLYGVWCCEPLDCVQK